MNVSGSPQIAISLARATLRSVPENRSPETQLCHGLSKTATTATSPSFFFLSFPRMLGNPVGGRRARSVVREETEPPTVTPQTDDALLGAVG